MNDLRRKGYELKTYQTMRELQKIATKKGISSHTTEKVVEEGWVGKPKGLEQVLWERVWIESTNHSDYSLKGKKTQMDDNVQLKPEFHK